MDEKRQVQQELFEDFSSTEKRRSFKPVFQTQKRMISMQLEHLIIMFMAFILAAALLFIIGVEKGKRSGPMPADIYAARGTEQPAAPVALTQPVRMQPVTGAPSALPTAPQEAVAQPAAPQAVPAVTFAGTEGSYTIQVASYVKKSDADKEAIKLTNDGSNAFVLTSGKYYAVCAGRFTTKEGASAASGKLKARYKDCYVRSFKG